MVDPRRTFMRRLERADVHLACLNAERDRWLSDSEGGCVVGKFHPQTGEYVFRLNGEPPTLTFGILVGDFVHALRSALDNIVWSLVRFRTGNEGSAATQFTIADTKAYWQQKYRSQLAGLWSTDRAIIREVQPYSRSNANPIVDPLSRLNWLNIRDKHHVVHASYVAQKPIDMSDLPAFGMHFWPVPDEGFEECSEKVTSVELRGGPFDSSDAVIAIAHLVGAPSDLKMHVQGTLPVDVAFGDPPHTVTVDDLIEIRDDVKAVIDRLGEAWN